MNAFEFLQGKLLISAHVTEVFGPVQALINFSKNNIPAFVAILHPLPISRLPSSECTTFLQGKREASDFRKIIRGPEFLLFAQHFLWTFFFVLKQREKYALFIGIDNLNALSGIILSRLGLVRKTVFYVIDYTPRRFTNSLLNSLYHLFDRICARNVDYVWNLSQRMATVRDKQGVQKARNLVVPVGARNDMTEYPPEGRADKNVLVFASHLTKSKGAELIIDAMGEVKETEPKVRLEIIGTGPHELELKERVRAKGMENCIRFLGLMDHATLVKHLPLCGIALATYAEDPDSITYFADPTKPKEYLGCGLPVIITRVPWIAKEIEARPMGIAINYEKNELVRAILRLLRNSKFYDECKTNAGTFTADLNWDNIFVKAFRQTTGN